MRDLVKRLSDWLFGPILLVTIFAVLMPTDGLPRAGLDYSWQFGMEQALAQGLIIGQDIIFTFGPYSSLYTKTLHPSSDLLLFFGSAYLAISLFLACFVNFKSSGPVLQLVLIFSLSTVALSRDAIFLVYPLLVGTFVFNEQLSHTGQPRRTAFDVALLTLLLTVFGLLPLIKGTALLACLPAILALAITFIARRQWPRLILVLLVPVLSCVALWLLAGQPLWALPYYFVSIWPVINGYTDAMSIWGSSSQIVIFLFGVAALFGSVLLGMFSKKGDKMRIALFLTLLISILFLGFKAGFVRHDGHALIAGHVLMFAALIGLAVSPNVLTWISLCGAIAIAMNIQWSFTGRGLAGSVVALPNTYARAWEMFSRVASDPSSIPKAFKNRLEELKEEGDLPSLPGTTDIYSYDQSFLISSDNKWNPRPIFQSYSAYTPELMRENSKHLETASGPDNVFFAIQPIDKRFPSLEDGASWPALLVQYEPVRKLTNNIVLHRRVNSGEFPQNAIHILTQANYRLDQKIEVPPSSLPVFAKIYIYPSLLGRIANVLFKSSPLEIRVTLQNGQERSFRFVAGMAKTGFLISPLVQTNSEFGLLYVDSDILSDNAVASFRVSPTWLSEMWGSSLVVEFFTVDFQRNSSFLRLFDIAKPVELKHSEYEFTDSCDGSIDVVNDETLPSSARANRLLNVKGWLAISSKAGQVPERAYLSLERDNGMQLIVRARPARRPDVASYFNRESLASSGYEVMADISGLKGEYSVRLAYEADGRTMVCRKISLPVTLNGGGLP